MLVRSTRFFTVSCAITGSPRCENISTKRYWTIASRHAKSSDHAQLQGLEPGE